MSFATSAIHNNQPVSLRPAGESELNQINLVITSAINAWQLPDRLKRLSLGLLHYEATDLQDYEILLYSRQDYPIAVGAWEHGTCYLGPGETASALLHGL